MTHRHLTSLVGSLTLVVAGCTATPPRNACAADGGDRAENAHATSRPRLGMELYVSPAGNFALSRPHGWSVSENAADGRQYVRVAAADDAAWVEVLYGRLSAQGRAEDVLDQLVATWRARAADLVLTSEAAPYDATRRAVEARFTDSHLGPRRARAWASVHDGRLFLAACESTAAEFGRWRETLLSVVVNLRPLKGAEITSNQPAAASVLPLVRHRLSDGSASFSVPVGWSCQEFGRGFFWCQEGEGGAGFGVARAEVLTPGLGVSVPGYATADYMAPREALPYLAAASGVADSFAMIQVTDRADLDRQLASVYTVGPVTTQEMVYTCTGAAGVRLKGYSLGISFGTRLGTNWSFNHLTVAAPTARFDSLAPTFAAMLASYDVDQDWARAYVAAGARRLAEMTRQTSRIIARNHAEITQMINEVYANRQRSQDYIDYQFSSYLRGESDWISGVEGGTVYHSDSWGLTDTSNGDHWDDAPWDWVHFEGANPRHHETMEQITTREQWERAQRP